MKRKIRYLLSNSSAGVSSTRWARNSEGFCWGPELSRLELPLDLLKVGEPVVVQEPVLQDLLGRRGVRVGDDVLDEAERVLAEFLDDVEVTMLLGLQVLQLEMGLHVSEPGDLIRHPKLRKSEGSPIVVFHGLVLNDRLLGCVFL
jgi:hypothetical protein